MAKFNRPDSGIRFQFGGMNTNDPPDALSPNKYPIAINVRGVMGKSIRTRPGYNLSFTAKDAITDIRAYSTLNTDNLPRLLARQANNKIALDNGVDVGVLAGSAQGAFMIPYRPRQSPQSWMYIGTPGDYQKLSAPDALNNVTQYKVGIREPYSPPEASPMEFDFYDYTGLAVSWQQSGTAGAPSDGVRSTDTVVAIFADPASNNTRYTLQIGNNVAYQVGELVNIVKSTGGSYNRVIEDVVAPIAATGTTISILAIHYYTGSTGRCVITISQTQPTLRRGMLVHISGGAGEACLVLSAVLGSDGTVCIEVSTTLTHIVGDILTGLPGIIVSSINNTVIGQTITSADITFNVTTGLGAMTKVLGTNPFLQLLGTRPSQADDYLCFNIRADILSNIVQGTIVFDIKNGAPDYTTDTLYYTFDLSSLLKNTSAINPSGTTTTTVDVSASNSISTQSNDLTGYAEFLANATPDEIVAWFTNTIVAGAALQQGVPNTVHITTDMVIAYIQSNYPGLITALTPSSNQTTTVTSLTPLPTSPWATLMIPISSLIRNGNDASRSIINCQAVKIFLQVSGSVSFAISSFWVGGGSQPTVANNVPYRYIFRPRNSTTNVVGNPSPATVYGVSPLRQSVRVELIDTVLDSQADIFDVFRYGGTVTSWRKIGFVHNTGSPVVFTDNQFDTSALAGELLEYDNLEPWPSIDLPYVATAGISAGITTSITAQGTSILVTYSAAAAFTDPAPANILSWLPGNKILASGISGYTLRSRPVLVTLASPPTAFYYAYLFELVEECGAVSPSSIQILEPNIANQHLPYLWGPNAQGDIFACGDPNRPGTVSFIKEHTPDSAPSNYNLEITNPSEPLLGGMVLGGSSLIASTSHWWAMNPAFDTAQRYYVVERQIGRGLIAPYGHCTDGKTGYFWAKDGIWATDGSNGISLTDTDLYNLFPHEGQAGSNVLYNGETIYAPDYKRASTFRLGFCNGFLYADYQDSAGDYHTLTYDISLKAWCGDEYDIACSTHYGIEQQEGTLLTPATLYPMLALGFDTGVVGYQADNVNDNLIPITVKLATLEFNGGDPRADVLWNDIMLDAIPVTGITATPISNRIAFAAAVTIPLSLTRSISPININTSSKFAGLFLTWTDNLPNGITSIFQWQPLFEALPISIYNWKPEGMGFGIPGYKSIWKLLLAYRATAPVTLTITAYDGTSPAVITLPSTGGAYKKTLFTLTPNKALLFFFNATCPSLWQPYIDEWEIFVAPWGRPGACTIYRDLPRVMGIG